MTKPERNYSVSEKECLAVIWAVRTFRPYLLGVEFDLNTDHSWLRCLMNIIDPSSRLLRWRLRLSEFDFDINYKKGSMNLHADAMSRLPRMQRDADDLPGIWMRIGTRLRLPTFQPGVLVNDNSESDDRRTETIADDPAVSMLDDNAIRSFNPDTENLSKECLSQSFSITQ